MVKNISIFICAFLIGICGVLFYFLHESPTPAKQNTSFFSIAKAPKDTLKADIVSFSGNVQWESRVATEPAKLTTLHSLQQGEELETGDTGNASLSFANRALLTLSTKTTVQLIQTLPANIVISQPSGTVVYKKITPEPFSVRSGDLLLSIVNGTTDVHVDAINQTVVVTVRTGKVTAAYTDLQNNTQTLSFSTGQQLVYDVTQQNATLN